MPASQLTPILHETRLADMIPLMLGKVLFLLRVRGHSEAVRTE
jgi:hypothetical protein